LLFLHVQNAFFIITYVTLYIECISYVYSNINTVPFITFYNNRKVLLKVKKKASEILALANCFVISGELFLTVTVFLKQVVLD